MTLQPAPDLGGFMRGVVVEDHVDELSGRDLALQRVEEADELLVAVSLHALPDDLAFEHMEGGKQGRGAVALVVVRHCSASTRLDRPAWLGAVERLDLRFFIDRKHDGMGWLSIGFEPGPLIGVQKVPP